MKKVIVTGGAGFLGSHLCRRLFEAGHHVVAIDNLYTGNRDNLKGLMGNKLFEFVQHDITKPINIPCDWIFNLACPASPPHYQKDPIFTTETNVIGSLNMLELARVHKARILQASTSEVYGDPLEHPQLESYRGNVNPIGPRACYDEGKRCAESLFFDFKRMHNVDVKVVRIFNTYGPDMDPKDGRVISNFIMQALRNEPITVYGHGNQTRSFCYVDDMIDGLVKMMESDATITGPINLGNPHEFTLLELITTLGNVLGRTLDVIHMKLPEDDPTRRRPDILLAEQMLGWQPTIDLATGLKKTIPYFQKFVS